MIEWIEVGIDYLSMTLDRSAYHIGAWTNRCYRVIEAIGKEGHEVRERSMNGYHGISAGNCFIGDRQDGYFVNLTGEYANRFLDEVYRPDAHYSRVDLQLTVKFNPVTGDIAQKGYASATHHNLTLPKPRQRKLYIIIGSDNGDTLYIGAPSSEQRGRLYNKAIQSGLDRYVGCWRYEVVFRNDLATECLNQCIGSFMPRNEYILAAVCKWYAERGVNTAHLQASSDVALPRQRAVKTDVERKLEWLTEQVKPTIRYLCDLGFRDTLLSLLELGDV